MSEKSDSKQRRLPRSAWKPGESGNPAGKPRGTRCKATVAAQALLDGESEALTRKAVELALAGDMTALRLCLERIVPPRKDSPIMMELPSMQSAADIPQAMGAILAAVAAGELSPSEGTAVAGLVELNRRALETSELEQRIAALEQGKGV